MEGNSQLVRRNGGGNRNTGIINNVLAALPNMGIQFSSTGPTDSIQISVTGTTASISIADNMHFHFQTTHSFEQDPTYYGSYPSSGNNTYRDRRSFRPPSARRQLPEPLNPGCANCRSADHEVKDCLDPKEHGFICGCPICNESHQYEQCPLRTKDKEDDYRVLVLERQNMPPLLNSNLDWFLLWVEKGRQRLPALPWSIQFSKLVHQREIRGFNPQEFDCADMTIADRVRLLPRDPSVADQQNVILHRQTWRRSDLPVSYNSSRPDMKTESNIVTVKVEEVD
ncbi:hypothetical protein QBC47DRAFT_435571 [Echria macrotheca]|uniref:Uncharacterized protein n=1 Tax=Echria macrotheca TaxID=438768 RepID=A0AAJ0B3D5_9PEZI|nr:hypothetical protein QBC47DRAFT_435571 [Echria macrotheca]